MKSLFVFALIVAAAVAAPAGSESDAQVVRQEQDNIGVDGYRFLYDTANGISQHEEGTLEGAGTPDEAIAVSGSYSYPGPDGVLITLSYIADRNGFQPTGAHLPVPPTA